MYYFDNAATTFPKPETVYETMDSFYRTYGVNVGRGQFKEASVANKMVENTRKMMLELFHATSDYYCIFTSSATEALNTILQGIKWAEGMIVYITPFEHNSVLRTLHYLEKTFGIIVKEIKPDENFVYDLNQIDNEFFKERPSVVVATHASNAFGFVNPINDIFNIAKKYDAITICDMAQTAGLIDTNIVLSKIDYAVFAGHKTLYGPFGIAGFVTNKCCSLETLIFGGTGIDSKNPDMPDEMPTKYEAGSHNILSIAGLNASLKWIKSIGIDEIFEKEKENADKLLEILRKYDNISIIRCNDEDKNIGVVSCVFDGYSSDNIGQVLSNLDIATRTGLHCAPKAHDFMGTAPAGTVRLSVNYFTDDDSFEALDDALEYIELNS